MLLLCVCLLPLWFTAPEEFILKVAAGVCLPGGSGGWLNHCPPQDDHVIGSAEGLQGQGVFPKADKNILHNLKDWDEAGGNTLCIATILWSGRKT